MEVCPKCKKPVEEVDRIAVERQTTVQTIHCSKCNYEGLPVTLDKDKSKKD